MYVFRIFCICTCSAQLSMFHMERCSRNTLIIIIILWVSGRGDFPMEFTWFLTPFPQNSFRWEYKPRSSLCTHAFHRTDSKDPNIDVLECQQQKYTQHAPSMKMQCDSLYGWIKKCSHNAQISPKMVNPRDIAGNAAGSRVELVKSLVSLDREEPGVMPVSQALKVDTWPWGQPDGTLKVVWTTWTLCQQISCFHTQ